jgi:hypothetical protein
MKMQAKFFLILQQFLPSNELDISQDIKTMFEGHLSQLIIWFEKYFQNENFDKFAWIQVPFNTSAPSEFIELSCDNSLKARFGSTELTEFWISIEDEYPLLSDKAQRILIPFSTSYLCEAGVSARCNKKQVQSKNQRGKGNEGGRVQFNSTI